MSVLFRSDEKLISSLRDMNNIQESTDPKDNTVWGPRFSPTNYNTLHLENFSPPRYEPRAVKANSINNQASGWIPQMCPDSEILMRNSAETYNTTPGKVYGGFDRYSIYSVPSCVQRRGDYMNFVDMTRPESRVIVSGNRPDIFAVARDRTWAKPTPQWLFQRLHS